MSTFSPNFSNPSDDQKLILCKILEAVSLGAQAGGNNINAFDVNVVPSIVNGFSQGYTFNSSSTAANNKQTIKSGAGLVGGVFINNTSGTDYYIKVFSDVITNVTLGTTAPIFNFRAQANTNLVLPLMPNGIAFSPGLSFAITTGAPALNSTLMSSGDSVIINLIYL